MGTRRHLGKVGVTAAVALTLTASLLATAGSSVASDPQPGAVMGAKAAPRLSGCVDVLVLGVDGNGQRPKRGATFGQTVESVTAKYARKLSAGRSVKTKRVALRTPGLATLTAGHRHGRTAVASIRTSSWRHWSAPVRPGTTKLMKTLDAAATACPEQQFVLVGYAQGAKIVHLSLLKAAKRSYAGRIAAGVLVSDPSRRGGIDARLGKGSAGALRSTPTFGAWGVCTGGDLVCAPGKSRLNPAVRKAHGYRGTAPAVRQARASALDRARRWPAPKPALRVSSALIDQPITVALQADVTAGARAGVRWSATDVLPAGLTLSETGVLSGVSSTTGQWKIPYTVTGTSPATTPHSGEVVLTVSDGATSVSAGGQDSCVTDGGGNATCRGANQFGQLGDGTTTGRSAFAPVRGTGWQSVSTSGATTCGIKTDATLWCWGLNNFGQLGAGNTTSRTKPQQLGLGLTWRKVVTSWFNTCAIDDVGDLYCWGQNLRGAAGTGSTSRTVSAPHLVGAAGAGWVDVSTGGWHTCAVRADGSLWCWGQNLFGQVGNTKSGVRSAPVRVGATGNWAAVSTSWGHSCAVTTTGELWCWGLNKDGQLGIGTRDDAWTPQRVAPGIVWTSVAAGDANTCGLDDAGATWCWGGNRYGQLGTGAAGSSTVPTRATAIPALSTLTMGWMHGCGLSGSVPTCWGSNEAGQLGEVSAGRRARSAVSATDLSGQRDAVRRGRAALRLSVAAQVAREIGDRPKVSASARRKKDPFTTKVMTFNLLGSQHTTVGGTRPDWAPGRIRSEWASSLIEARGGSLVGIQEIQPDQVTSLDVATDHQYEIWPGTSKGYAGAPQSVMWKTSEWTAVWKSTITIPFMRTQPRPQPVVRLRNKATGRDVYWINAHFSPGKMESDRRRATAIVIKTVKKLRKDGLPILVTGDFNDHNRVFCQVTSKTALRAALGGSSNKKACRPPAARRVDWIFGTGGAFGKVGISQGAQVRRTTDHAIQDVSFSVQ